MTPAVARVARRVAAALDRMDAALWQAERRQAFRDRHTIPPGEEARYQRLQALWQWQERGDQ